jgi:siroheme synthase-like protein
MARLFPIFLKLKGRRVLMVGDSAIAEAKIAGLMDTGAVIRVVTGRDRNFTKDGDLTANLTLRKWAREGLIELEEREFVANDLEEVYLVVAATRSSALSTEVYAAAQEQGALCNVVDVNDECDFYYPAVVERGDLQIAISTGGESPSLAQRLRKQLEAQFGFGYAEWIRKLGETRSAILKSGLSPDKKRELLQSLANREALDAAVEEEKTKRNKHQENCGREELSAERVAV